MPIYEDGVIKPSVVISDKVNPTDEINVQIDDIGKTYKLTCRVKLKSTISFLEDGVTPGHQHQFELKNVQSFEEVV